MRIISSHEQQAIDQIWHSQTGLPLLLLMESAARAVVQQCFRLSEQENRASFPVLVLCGPGQNGGDGYACARLLLAANWPVICREILPEVTRPMEAQANRTALIHLGCSIKEPEESDFLAVDGGLIIDGLFGSGFDPDRPVADAFRRLSQQIATSRASGSRVIAIDVPSGVDGDSGRVSDWAIRADWTVTFVYPKIGLCTGPGRLAAGEWIVDSIGIQDRWAEQVLSSSNAVHLIDPGLIAPWCPKRPPNAHKGTLGRVLIFAGSAHMPGAAVLAAESAGRSGVGLVHLMVPAEMTSTAVAACPEALIQGIGKEAPAPEIFDLAIEQADAVAIGPGIGSPGYLKELLDWLIQKASRLVIDADALNLMAQNASHYQNLLRLRSGSQALQPVVLTPHPGEFKRLAPDIDLQDRRQAACLLAARWHSVVVLKGFGTVVAEPDQNSFISMTGHDGLARGGSGDILTGLIAGLLAQKMSPEQAAGAAVWIHGKAAQLAARTLSRRAMLPRDVIDHLSQAWRSAGWEVADD